MDKVWNLFQILAYSIYVKPNSAIKEDDLLLLHILKVRSGQSQMISLVEGSILSFCIIARLHPRNRDEHIDQRGRLQHIAQKV